MQQNYTVNQRLYYKVFLSSCNTVILSPVVTSADLKQNFIAIQKNSFSVILTGNCLGGCWFALTCAPLRHEDDVVQMPGLQLPNVGGVLVSWDGYFMTPPCSVAGCDGQTVPVNLTL